MSVNNCKRQLKKQRIKKKRSLKLISTGMAGVAGSGAQTVTPSQPVMLPSEQPADSVQNNQLKPVQRSNGKPAAMPLPANIQEEIAIIRGKKFGELSPSLKRLENSILGIDEKDSHQAKGVTSKIVSSQNSLTNASFVTSKSYDSGQAISFENGWQGKPEYIPPAQSSPGQWGGQVFQSLSSAAPADTMHNYDSYNVEDFEPAEYQQAPISRQQGQVEPVSKKPVPVDKTENEQKQTELLKQKLIDQEQQKPQFIEDYPEDEELITAPQTLPTKKPSVAPSAQDKKSVELALKELEQDLEAVMGRKPEPDTRTQPQSTPQTELESDQSNSYQSNSASTAETPQAPGEQLGDPHAIFEQMSMGMPYANTFNLGSMDLSRTFEQFDREIDAQEALEKSSQKLVAKPSQNQTQQKQTPFIDPESPDKLDVLADLADITQAQLAQKQRESQEVIQKQKEELEKYRKAEASKPENTSDVESSTAADQTQKKTDAQQQSEQIQTKQSRDDQQQEQSKQQQPKQQQQQPTTSESGQEKKPTPGDASSTIQYKVPLLNAIEDMSPAATGAAMLVAWHHKQTPSMSEISNGEGIWKDYILSLNIKGPEVISAWGLTKMEQALSTNNLKDTLQSAGPLLLLQEQDNAVKLITGLKPGDPEPVISIIEVNKDGASSARELNQSDITSASDQLIVAHI